MRIKESPKSAGTKKGMVIKENSRSIVEDLLNRSRARKDASL